MPKKSNFQEKKRKKTILIEFISTISIIINMLIGLFSFMISFKLNLGIFSGFLIFLYLLGSMIIMTIGLNHLKAGKRFFLDDDLRKGAKFIFFGGLMSINILAIFSGLWMIVIIKKSG